VEKRLSGAARFQRPEAGSPNRRTRHLRRRVRKTVLSLFDLMFKICYIASRAFAGAEAVRFPRQGENHGTVRAGLSVCDPLGRGSVESAWRAIIWWREVRIQAFPQGGFGSAVIFFRINLLELADIALSAQRHFHSGARVED
jgi:hypothetical protein